MQTSSQRMSRDQDHQGLPGLWLQNLPQEQKEATAKVLRHSINGVLPTRLREILQHKIKEITSNELRTEVFDNPNWAYKQAHSNGMIKALTNILDLLNFNE